MKKDGITRRDFLNGTQVGIGAAVTGTLANPWTKVFGSAARDLVISSTKSAVGHSLGASGGVELIAAIRAILSCVVPPTINLDNPGEGCDLDYCPKAARDQQVNVAMSNSFGFGGHNACILVRRFE